MSVGPSGTPLARQRLPRSMAISALFTQQAKHRPALQCASMHGAGVPQQYGHQASSLVLPWSKDQTTSHAFSTEVMMSLSLLDLAISMSVMYGSCISAS